MISSGLFILPGLAYAQTGPPVFMSYFLAGFLAFPGTLSVIELFTAMPKPLEISFDRTHITRLVLRTYSVMPPWENGRLRIIL